MTYPKRRYITTLPKNTRPTHRMRITQDIMKHPTREESTSMSPLSTSAPCTISARTQSMMSRIHSESLRLHCRPSSKRSSSPNRSILHLLQSLNTRGSITRSRSRLNANLARNASQSLFNSTHQKSSHLSTRPTRSPSLSLSNSRHKNPSQLNQSPRKLLSLNQSFSQDQYSPSSPIMLTLGVIQKNRIKLDTKALTRGDPIQLKEHQAQTMVTSPSQFQFQFLLLLLSPSYQTRGNQSSHFNLTMSPRSQVKDNQQIQIHHTTMSPKYQTRDNQFQANLLNTLVHTTSMSLKYRISDNHRRPRARNIQAHLTNMSLKYLIRDNQSSPRRPRALVHLTI